MTSNEKFKQNVKTENEQMPHKKDGLFYSLWKYANADRLTGKSLISFSDLVPLEGTERFNIFDFLNSLQELKIELEGINFNEDIYKKYCEAEYEYIIEYITKNPETDFSRRIKNLFKNQATFKDVFGILGKFNELAKLKLRLSGLLEFIEFNPTPTEKNIKPLKDYLDAYLDCFIEDKLIDDKKNYYKFEKQTEITFYNLRKYIDKYGNHFIFEYGKDTEEAMFRGLDTEYLFIHSLATLEKEEFFSVENILIVDMDVPPEKQTNNYKIKISINPDLISDILLGSIKKYLSGIPDKIDYSSNNERRAWEKKWNVLQVIWTAYKTLDNPKNILVPMNALIGRNTDKNLIEMMLSDYSKIGCFSGFGVRENNYILYKVNYEKLEKTYQKTKTIYEKFAQSYQGRIKKENAVLEALEKRLEKSKENQKLKQEIIEEIKNQQQLIQKIEIVGMPEVKIKGFEEKVVLQKPKNKRLQLRNFPKDLKWEEITIRFLNKHEVIITARDDTFQINYNALGFQDEKRKLPNKQWTFLELLAIKNGELSWENNKNLSLKEIDSIKKKKQLLAETLKAYFQIEDEPFLDYKKEKAYKTKINLIPEADSTANTKEEEIYEDDEDDLGIEEDRKEQSPEVYEE